MHISDFRRNCIGDTKDAAKLPNNNKFAYSKSEPAEFLAKNTRKINFDVLQLPCRETSKRSTSFSFSNPRDHKIQAGELSFVHERPQELKQLSKPIIHDTFSNYLSTNYKTFRIGLNTVAIKKKFRFEKNGIGELACNLAKPKPISTKHQTSPQPNQKKAYLRQLYQRQEMRLRNRSTELNEWSRKLQLLQNNDNNKVYAKSKTQQPPVLVNIRKKNEKIDHFKPWSNIDQSFAHKKPRTLKSSFDLYDILQ